MDETELVDRLAALPNLASIPRPELEWLAAHGSLDVHEAGAVIARKGERIETLWILLSGRIAVRVDRGMGPRRVTGWEAGQVSGMLPFSRMKAPPGDNYVEVRTERLLIVERDFPEMIRRCPEFTAYTVHIMLDRARSFNASALHDEKMSSLGKLAAGLAHELNNPASATVRGAKLLADEFDRAERAARALGAAGLSDEQLKILERIRRDSTAEPPNLSAVEQADREDEIIDWLEARGADPGLATPLAESSLSPDDLEALAEAVPAAALGTAIRSLAIGCTIRSLTTDIDRAATRIYDLVTAVKKFTYMDNLAGPEIVDIEGGLRDTVRMVASKAAAKKASVTLDVEDGLPSVSANGGELNQVWLNLIDNALDAVDESGAVEVTARHELDRIVVRVIDDGPGIPAELTDVIFDPFFTTKPPGEGTGLGLDITRRLLRRYHGDITVRSRPGRTEFRVSLLPEKPS